MVKKGINMLKTKEDIGSARKVVKKQLKIVCTFLKVSLLTRIAYTLCSPSKATNFNSTFFILSKALVISSSQRFIWVRSSMVK